MRLLIVTPCVPPAFAPPLPGWTTLCGWASPAQPDQTMPWLTLHPMPPSRPSQAGQPQPGGRGHQGRRAAHRLHRNTGQLHSRGLGCGASCCGGGHGSGGHAPLGFAALCRLLIVHGPRPSLHPAKHAATLTAAALGAPPSKHRLCTCCGSTPRADWWCLPTSWGCTSSSTSCCTGGRSLMPPQIAGACGRCYANTGAGPLACISNVLCVHISHLPAQFVLCILRTRAPSSFL